MKHKIKELLCLFVILSALIAGCVAFGKFVFAEKKIEVVYQAVAQTKELPEDIIIRVCKEENVPYIICLRVSICESDFDPYFKEKIISRAGIVSYDRGIFAINSVHYSQISDERAFSVEEATRVFAKEYTAGKAKNWLCYNSIY